VVHAQDEHWIGFRPLKYNQSGTNPGFFVTSNSPPRHARCPLTGQKEESQMGKNKENDGTQQGAQRHAHSQQGEKTKSRQAEFENSGC
jgi:hypothetical protein